MRKTLALLMALAMPVSAVRGLSKPSPVAIARPWTVIVTNEGLGGGGRGTGILIDETHVLTCLHMVNEARDEFFIYTYPLGRVIHATAEGGSAANDLAILTLDEPVKLAAYATFQETHYDGEEIYVVGNALGSMKWVVTRGVLSGEDRGYILTDAVVNPGNSGGPWVDDEGAVVALTDWRIGPSEAHHYPGLAGGISATVIRQFILSWKLASALQGVRP